MSTRACPYCHAAASNVPPCTGPQQLVRACAHEVTVGHRGGGKLVITSTMRASDRALIPAPGEQHRVILPQASDFEADCLPLIPRQVWAKLELEEQQFVRDIMPRYGLRVRLVMRGLLRGFVAPANVAAAGSVVDSTVRHWKSDYPGLRDDLAIIAGLGGAIQARKLMDAALGDGRSAQRARVRAEGARPRDLWPQTRRAAGDGRRRPHAPARDHRGLGSRPPGATPAPGAAAPAIGDPRSTRRTVPANVSEPACEEGVDRKEHEPDDEQDRSQHQPTDEHPGVRPRVHAGDFTFRGAPAARASGEPTGQGQRMHGSPYQRTVTFSLAIGR